MSIPLRPSCFGFQWGTMFVQRMASLAREGHGWYTVLGVGTEKAPYRVQVTMTKSGRITVVVDGDIVFDESGRHPKAVNRPDWDTPGMAGPLPLEQAIPVDSMGYAVNAPWDTYGFAINLKKDPRVVRLGGGDGLIPTPPLGDLKG